ncbi:MAG: DUF2794 domain-containing protein [Pseudomonadota bacterium]
MSFITQMHPKRPALKTAFHRSELSLILDVYGRLVMAGEAKDYGIGMGKDEAVFAIYRRHADHPTWTILKTPRLANAQGAYSVQGSQGQVLKRGRDLKQVLSVFDRKRFEVV